MKVGELLAPGALNFQGLWVPFCISTFGRQSCPARSAALELARFYHGRRSGLGQQIIQLCKASLCAFYRFIGGIDPTGANILACSHLTRLQKLKLLLDACLLLLTTTQ